MAKSKKDASSTPKKKTSKPKQEEEVVETLETKEKVKTVYVEKKSDNTGWKIAGIAIATPFIVVGILVVLIICCCICFCYMLFASASNVQFDGLDQLTDSLNQIEDEYDSLKNELSDEEVIPETGFDNLIGDLQTYEVGETITYEDFVVSVNEVDSDYQSRNRIFTPKEGNKFIAFEITYKNSSDNEITYNGLLDWLLKGNDGENYNPVLLGNKQPDLGYGKLLKNESFTGWKTFEVPQDFESGLLFFSKDILKSDGFYVNVSL